MFAGLRAQGEEVRSQGRPGWFVGEVGYDLVGSAVQRRYPLGSDDLLGGGLQGVGVALNGFVEPGRGVADLSEQGAG